VFFLGIGFTVFSAVFIQAQTAEEPSPSSEYIAGQTNTNKGSFPDFFIAPLTEVIGYSSKGLAIGGGFALGAGDGVAIGLRLLYAIDTESVSTLELAVFLRFYLLGSGVHTGPFVQVISGADIHARENDWSLSARAGAFSAGLAAGWRFLLGNRWYIEPVVRVGYPYIAGVGVSAAFRLL
jgi:hypothetical protein